MYLAVTAKLEILIVNLNSPRITTMVSYYIVS